jgi:hypothetical protein
LATRGSAPTHQTDPAIELVGEPYPPEIIVVGARYLDGYRFLVQFADGFSREVDMTDELDGEVFEPLRDQQLFAALKFDEEAQTVVWPNGTDLAPEFLRWGPHQESGCECGH